MDENIISHNEEKQMEKEIEKNIEKNVEELVKKNAERIIPPFIIEVVVVIGVSIVFLILLNAYSGIIPFLNDDFNQILPVFNLVLTINIVTSLLQIPFLTSQKVKYLMNTIRNVASLYIAYHLWIVFPFDNSWSSNPHLWDSVFRWAIGITAFLTVLSTFVEGGKMLAGNSMNEG